ncbi:MAG: hypothetical protein PHY08_12625 [Candidatus Cloacimonetes bacterium]|nr:hypothetical protein [Candidatus Cloacimonadota bacterium]
MYNREEINELIEFIKENKSKSKSKLIDVVVSKFSLTRDRSVFYNKYYAIRFSEAKTKGFSNTVLSLSALQKYDHIPFIVCVSTLGDVCLLLANSSFLTKISHSSHQLRINNIKGSFNGSDIVKVFGPFTNDEKNFEEMFAFHQGIPFEDNLSRLVESTNQIVGTGTKFITTKEKEFTIINSVNRAVDFLQSSYYEILNNDLRGRVSKVENEIVIASLIDNVNVRGRVIEYLITQGESDGIRKEIISALQNKTELPYIKNEDDLGDYNIHYKNHETKTDIKTKVLYLNSSPKAYNIDKLLEFLSKKKSTYLIYFIGVDSKDNIDTFLCSVFNNELLNGTHFQFHWSGRNSRGVAQFSGRIIDKVLNEKNNYIDECRSKEWLKELISR